jgi:hypothetical protein
VKEEYLMATTEAVTNLLSESEHSRELRKAVIASTVGTTIEWYDFLLYSVVTAGGPAPLIAAALLAAYGSGYIIALYIALTALISVAATALMTDYTGRDISKEHA